MAVSAVETLDVYVNAEDDETIKRLATWIRPTWRFHDKELKTKVMTHSRHDFVYMKTSCGINEVNPKIAVVTCIIIAWLSSQQ